METMQINVKYWGKNDEFKQALENLISKKSEFKFIRNGSQEYIDLLFFEMDNDFDKGFRFVESQLNSQRVGEVFITSANQDSEILIKALRAGIKEFFPVPLNKDDVELALDRFIERRQRHFENEAPRTNKIISFFGCKGGVGTTTVAVNVARALKAKDQSLSVALVDLNVLFGDASTLLDLEIKHHWGEISKNVDRLDDTFMMTALAEHDSGVFLLPSPNDVSENNKVTPYAVERIVEQMKQMFDYIIIDSGQTLDDAFFKIYEMSDNFILVSIQSLPCITNTYKLLYTLSKLGYSPKDRVQVVLNRYMKRKDITDAFIEKTIHQPIHWKIPNDYKNTMNAINEGRPVVDYAPRTAVSKCILDLAKTLVPQDEQQKKSKWKLF
jgi:pilus assembly protein CpaE